jgi:DNA-binding MarR family transcriptional regulator
MPQVCSRKGPNGRLDRLVRYPSGRRYWALRPDPNVSYRPIGSVDAAVACPDSRNDMVATKQTSPNPKPEPAGEPSGAPDLTAEQAARRIARLFPEVYRRYHWAQKVRGGDLPATRRGLGVLQHLAACGPLTVGEQAEHLGLRRNSVSELLQRLEAKGLVARVRDERDERRVLVWLTEAGRDVASRVGQILAPDLLTDSLAALSPAERAIVVRGFELLASAESNHAPNPTPQEERDARPIKL